MFTLNRKQAVKAVLDPVTVVLIVLVFVFSASTFTFLATDPYIAQIMVFYIACTGFCAAFAFGLKLTKVDVKMDEKETNHAAWFVAVGLALSLAFQWMILNSTTKIEIADVLGRKMFYGCAAVTETVIFQWLLFTLFERASHFTALNAVVISCIFVPFHAAVYGLSNPVLCAAVFVNSMIFCLTYAYSGYCVIVPTLIHLIINFTAG